MRNQSVTTSMERQKSQIHLCPSCTLLLLFANGEMDPQRVGWKKCRFHYSKQKWFIDTCHPDVQNSPKPCESRFGCSSRFYFLLEHLTNIPYTSWNHQDENTTCCLGDRNPTKEPLGTGSTRTSSFIWLVNKPVDLICTWVLYLPATCSAGLPSWTCGKCTWKTKKKWWNNGCAVFSVSTHP
jgi:hypothetical protein